MFATKLARRSGAHREDDQTKTQTQGALPPAPPEVYRFGSHRQDAENTPPNKENTARSDERVASCRMTGRRARGHATALPDGGATTLSSTSRPAATFGSSTLLPVTAKALNFGGCGGQSPLRLRYFLLFRLGSDPLNPKYNAGGE
jgi:hypothetical protein